METGSKSSHAGPGPRGGQGLRESWEFLPDGIAMFGEKYGADADAQIADRTRQALDGIPKTLAAIKRIAESAAAHEDARS